MMHERGKILGWLVPTCASAVTIISPARAGSIDMITINEAGNPPDTNGLGHVAEEFQLAVYEVTNPQYVEFLNAVAAADVNGLYDELMTSSGRGGILRDGAPGSYTYSVKPDFDDKPVVAIDWLDAARFCNWLHNGKPIGSQTPTTTEDGAYDMSLAHDAIAREPGATFFIPTHDEWYKAAYYDPFLPGADASGTPDYWLYPTRSDAQPVQALASTTGDVTNPGANVANHSGGADWNGENGNVTTVGGCESPGPWGTFDMGGNVYEWTEDLDTPIPPNPPNQPDPLPTRTARGGDYTNSGVLMASPVGLSIALNMVAEGANIGFRVAAIAPPPPCPGDLDDDGVIAFADLLILLADWGACDPKGPSCPADLDDSGTVGFNDLLILLAAWGACA